MTFGVPPTKKCDDFGWRPRGPIDPGLVSQTTQHQRFGFARARSRFSSYELSAEPRLTHVVYTAEGITEFMIGGSRITAEAESLILLDGTEPTIARTFSETACFGWYLESTFFEPGRSGFRFNEPIVARSASIRALLSLTNFVLNEGLPASESARRHVGMALENLIASALHDAAVSASDRDSHLREGPFAAARLAIESRFRDPAFTVTQLAKDLSVSVRTVHDSFNRIGTTPRREIERRRVQEVQNLRDDPALSRSEVAERAGFTSVKQMNRALSRVVGQPAHSRREGVRHSA